MLLTRRIAKKQLNFTQQRAAYRVAIEVLSIFAISLRQLFNNNLE